MQFVFLPSEDNIFWKNSVRAETTVFKGLFKDNKRTVTALENVVLYNKTYEVNFTYAEKDTILTIFPINLFKMFMKLFFF